MGYYIDLKKFSVDKFEKTIKSTELIPSWKILEENIDENFQTLRNFNIKNLDDIISTFSKKDNINNFSKQCGISAAYLQVLNRVAKGYIQKPNKLKDFPNISQKIADKFYERGFTNTLKIYNHVLTKKDREKLSDEIKINSEEITKIAKLSDLSRIRWVNHNFAYILYEAGFDSAKKVADADSRTLYEKIKMLNDEKKIYNASISIRDMQMCIDSAKMLEMEIEF